MLKRNYAVKYLVVLSYTRIVFIPAHVPFESAISEALCTDRKKNKVDKWTTTSLAKDLNSDGTCRCHCKATGKQLEVVSTRIVVRGGLEC